jgi:TetR/AcrR family transcriptional regulator, cholesterol catabolism regulator
MDEKEEKIIRQATEVFMRYGIKSVNMDDISRHLGISKKTLYQVVKDKADLVQKTVRHFCSHEECSIGIISGQKLNAIDQSLEIMKWVLSILKSTNPAVEFDLQKYHPEIYRELRQNRDRLAYGVMLRNIRKGQREGLYRKDFRPELIARLYMAQMEAMFDQNLFPFPEWNLGEIYTQTFVYHIRGIASEKGHEYLREKMKLKS